jgi:hypothetical protein
VSELDLSSSLEAARKETEAAAKRYIAAQEGMVSAENELREARNKSQRLERAMRIINGEEEPAAAVATATATTAPPVAPPPPPKPAPSGPFANLACSACTSVGKMEEVWKPTKNGSMAHLLVCSDCKNERYLG